MGSQTRNGLLALALLALPSAAGAQEVQLTGPLAGAPAIKRLVLHRAGRLHLTVMPTFTFGDEYVRHLLAGARVEYNLLDFLAIGLWGSYGVYTVENGLSDEVQNKAYANEGSQDYNQNLNFPYGDNSGDFYGRPRFPDQLGRIQWVGGAQLTLAPLRGKVGLVGKAFVDVDVFGFVGAAAVGVQERANTERPTNEDNPASIATASRTTFAPMFGAGINMYFNNFIGMTMEYRALPFSWNRSGTDECCTDEGEAFPDHKIDDQDRQLSFNQMFSVGVIFALPTTPTIDE
ncbi:MAG: hypothetical protein HYY06_14595 [Deltaproteobacteria bacterium]|nr:hypothetical protein [Deltaproteobacteria bacterium]